MGFNRDRFDFAECLLPEAKLRELGPACANQYREAKPFPHIVFDDFFDEAILDRIVAEFPDPNRSDWQRFANSREVKLASKGEWQLSHFTRYFVYLLNSSAFLTFLEQLTGIAGLLPDPHLMGAGLHQIVPGGKLAVHADFNVNQRLRLDRRLNVLVYLNRDWKPEFGGHFELWDETMAGCVERVLPLFNRMVVFSTTETSYHGHPDPLTCPPDRTRRSLALYYYSNGRPEEGARTRADAHSTVFVTRPGESFAMSPGEWTVHIAKKWVPPIAIDLVRAIRGT